LHQPQREILLCEADEVLSQNLERFLVEEDGVCEESVCHAADDVEMAVDVRVRLEDAFVEVEVRMGDEVPEGAEREGVDEGGSEVGEEELVVEDVEEEEEEEKEEAEEEKAEEREDEEILEDAGDGGAGGGRSGGERSRWVGNGSTVQRSDGGRG
jgi:hypothetical protein